MAKNACKLDSVAVKRITEQLDADCPLQGFIRLPAIIKLLGIGKTSFYRGVREGRFPKPMKIGPRTSAWRVKDIRDLLESFDDGNGQD